MNKILLLLLVVLITTTAKSETKQETAPKVVKVNIKADSNTVKGIPVDSLDSKVKKVPTANIKVAKNQLQPRSDSFFDTTVYVFKKLFEDHPIIMIVLCIVMLLGIRSIIIQFFENQ